ncbi:uncharacterized protein LOC127808316 [Diospyros lotus]|uniref:uncharacterized protein LOC127808316 n=1 Tax=Diospyros lotus TaxID=55363 RepID=UPI00224DF4E6|nr:uncharacterized protein LOC127808316 [Diospyros lotus]
MNMDGFHHDVNCDDPVDKNGLEEVNYDDGGHSAEDVFNCDDVRARSGEVEVFNGIDVEKLVHIDVQVGDGAEQPIFLPSSRLSRVSSATSSQVSEVELNQIFASKSKLHQRMSLLALRKNYEYKVVKSTTKVLYMKCKHDQCQWRLRETTLGTSFGWVVRKYVNTHSCLSSIMRRGYCQVKSRVIGSHVKPYYMDVKRIHKPKNIINNVHKEFGLKNPGTIVEIESDSESRFKYLFMAIGACLAGFRSQMRPVIAIDACFLKGKYLGSLFVATCKDGNKNVYAIAWGVGDSENDASWEWFFIKLRSAIGHEIPDLVFVSDRHKSISKTAAKAYRESEFHELFNELERYDPAVDTYLREAGFSRWARAYLDGKRFDIMTTNIAECLNAALADACKLPIQCLMEFNVKYGNSSGIVDLKAKTCICRVFDFDKLPCGHALAAAPSCNIDPYTLSSAYYQTEALLYAYANPIMSVGSQADWIVPNESASINLLPPATRCPCGRRKTCQIPSVDKEKRRVKCGRCGQIGHNRQTCSNPISLDEKKEGSSKGARVDHV